MDWIDAYSISAVFDMLPQLIPVWTAWRVVCRRVRPSKANAKSAAATDHLFASGEGRKRQLRQLQVRNFNCLDYVPRSGAFGLLPYHCWTQHANVADSCR